jgi:methylated-DNA-[protein]-cysteine S-methyltransferase
MDNPTTDVKLYYTTFETAMGWVGILGSERGLRRSILPHDSEKDILNALGDDIGGAALSANYFENLVVRLRDYFTGKEVSFPDALDLAAYTPFQRRAWEITRNIPFGETRSYSWIAQQMQNPLAMRAVGTALSKNPLPVIVPCHRVLAINGKLGGFSDGLDMKRSLLQLEAYAVTSRIKA